MMETTHARPHAAAMTAFSLDGRAALVTGATAGIGLAMARAFAGASARVVVGGLGDAEAVARALPGAGHVGVDADLANPTALERLIAAARAGVGRVDVLVLSAAVQHRAGYAEVTADQIAHQVAVNLTASLALVAAFAPAMRQAGHGRIIAVGSVQEARPNPKTPVYAALKAGQENLIRNLAVQFARDGVTCNVISPGVVETDRSRPALADPAARAAWLARIPLARFGRPEDCVGAALLLASEAGAYVTGQTIRVDGGLSVG